MQADIRHGHAAGMMIHCQAGTVTVTDHHHDDASLSLSDLHEPESIP
jgi:hypothetical protein